MLMFGRVVREIRDERRDRQMYRRVHHNALLPVRGRRTVESYTVHCNFRRETTPPLTPEWNYARWRPGEVTTMTRRARQAAYRGENRRGRAAKYGQRSGRPTHHCPGRGPV